MIKQRVRRHEAGEETFVLEDSDLLAGVLLRDRDLSGARIVNCDLRKSSFQRTDLSGADLRGSDLRGADLRGTDLTGANLEGTRMDASVPTHVMESQEEGPEGVDDREPSDVWEEPDNPVEFHENGLENEVSDEEEGKEEEGTRMDASVPTHVMESQEEGTEGVDDREPSDVWEEPDNPVESLDKAERDESPPEPGGNASDES